MDTTHQSTALITGANKGIGFAIAQQLGKQGFSVWLGCRNQERGQKAVVELRASGIDAHLVLLDVTSSESIQEAVRHLENEVDALNVLVNNAGMHFGPPPPVSEESVDDMRAMFEVNAFGAVRVTQAFLPLLRQSKGGRIVMVSSGLGSVASTMDMTSENWNVGFAGYCASKSALHMFTVKFAKELSAEGIKVNAADPGLTATDLTGHMGKRTTDEAATIAVRLATLDAFGPTGGFFHDGHQLEGMAKHLW